MTGPSNNNSNFWKNKETSALYYNFLYHIIQKEVLTLFESCSEACLLVIQKELQLHIVFKNNSATVARSTGIEKGSL